MRILICTDGSAGSVQSAELVYKLGFSTQTRITVLGVSETKDDMNKLTASMELIDKILGLSYDVDRKIRNGNPFEEIMSEALESTTDLVAVGGGGTQLGLLHPKLGSTTSKLARKLHTHFLVGRNIPDQVTKVLVCVGADAPSNTTLKLGGAWVSNTSAQIALIHVLPVKTQIAVNEHVTGTMLKTSSPDTNEDRDILLTNSSQLLRNVGVKNDILSRIRHGLVVEEVINELSEGGYDLLVVGAHYQPGQDRWQGTLLDDVTDQLLNRSTCSVLII